MGLIDFLKKVFNKKNSNIPLNSGKTPYQQVVESIDDLELSKLFLNSIKKDVEGKLPPHGENDRPYEYELQTKISENDTIELARKFFKQFYNDIQNKVNSILDHNNYDINLVMEKFNGKGSYASNPDDKKIEVYVPIRGDIRQLYELVHELTHTLDMKNGDNVTRKVLGEVAPQCNERLLDEFLLNLSDEEMKQYGLDKEVLRQDVQNRKISTFADRYRLAKNLYNGVGQRENCSRYMLAQIYQSKFDKYAREDKLKKLIEFIKCVENDCFEEANKVLGLKIQKEEKINRENLIVGTISEIENLIQSDNVEENYKNKTIDENVIEI